MVRNCNSFLLSIITAFLFLASSCDDDTATLGSSLMPESDNVTTSQVAYKVNTRSVFIDSVLANTKTCYLGCIIDPETRAKTTSDFLAQFHMMENYRLPKKEKMLVDNQGKVVADSCDIRIYFDEYYGDSLTTMKLFVQELDTCKVMEENTNYYTNIDPSEYVSNTSLIKKVQTYSIRDLAKPDSLDAVSGTYYRSVVVRLPAEYGSFILNKYYENPEYFKNSYQFIHHVCPGFYFQTIGGVGSMIKVEVSALNVYFRYKTKNTAGNDTIVDGMQRMAATEEVIQNNHIENKIPDEMLDHQNGYTYVKSPTGIFTEVELPVDEILSNGHYNDTINSAQITFRRFNHEVPSIYNLGAPSDLLLVRKSETFSFFEKEKLPNDGNTYISTFNAAQNAYVFSNIAQLITNLKNERDKGAGVIKTDTETQRKQKYIEWEGRNPDWNKLMLIPVASEYSTSTNSYGQTVKQLLRVRNELSLRSAKLEGGDGNIDISVVYSRFSNE